MHVKGGVCEGSQSRKSLISHCLCTFTSFGGSPLRGQSVPCLSLLVQGSCLPGTMFGPCCILVSMSRQYSVLLQTSWCKLPTPSSHRLGGWEIQSASDLGSWTDASSWLTDGHLLALLSQGREGEGSGLFLLEHGYQPHHEGPPLMPLSKPNYTLKSPLSDTLGSRVSTKKFFWYSQCQQHIHISLFETPSGVDWGYLNKRSPCGLLFTVVQGRILSSTNLFGREVYNKMRLWVLPPWIHSSWDLQAVLLFEDSQVLLLRTLQVH